MGGHGGLNILPQKRWNVYNYENREKVRLDEEAAAKEEQLKREQSRKRDAEFRLEKLRKARGLSAPQANGRSNPSLGSSDSKHINLFEGLKDFDSLKGGDEEKGKEKTVRKEGFKRQKREEETAKVISPEDEKYRLGYGIAGKGVQAPWYLLRPLDGMEPEVSGKNSGASGLAQVDSGIKKSGKKTVEELREERMKREKREKERERALMLGNNNSDGVAAKPRRFSRLRWVFNHAQVGLK